MKRKSTFIKLILSAVLTGVSALANGQTVAEYNKANELIKDGQQYRIYTMNGGTKYYFTDSGELDTYEGTAAHRANNVILGTARANACIFTFNQYTTGSYKIGSETCNKGWHIEFTDNNTGKVGRFTNPANTTATTNWLRRNIKGREGDFETQLLFAQETSEGSGEYKYAVRSTANSGTGWGADAFWYTFTPEGAELPTAGYDLSNDTRGKATYYDFYLEEVDYSQLYENEQLTKTTFADANAGVTACPWRFFKSRPRRLDTNAYTDGCSYDEETAVYSHSSNAVYQKPNGEFYGKKPGNVFYSIASRYQNLAGAEKWYKVENKVTANSKSEPVYMELYYTASTATSGNLLNNVKPFHNIFAGNATSDRVIYVKMPANSSLYFVPEGTSWKDTYGTIDYIKINAVDEADIPAGALCYNGSNLSYELNVTSAGYATLVLPFAAAKPENLVLYKLDEAKSNGTIMVTEQDGLIANEPVLVKADEGKYTFTATAAGNDANAEMTSGLLTGTYDRVQMTTGNYLLQNHNGVVGFYKVGETTKPYVGGFRAYMKSGVSSVRELTFGDGEETGIENIAMPFDELRTGSVTDVQPMFNLQGQRVDASYRGVVIMNGKKVINK